MGTGNIAASLDYSCFTVKIRPSWLTCEQLVMVPILKQI